MKPLYCVKVGSATIDRAALGESGVHAEIAQLVRRGARVLMVAGGAAGIERHYRAVGRPVPRLRLAGGDAIRYCPPEEMAHLVDAYRRVTLPAVEAGLRAHGMRVHAAPAVELVRGRANRPLRVQSASGGTRLVRDHRAGLPTEVDTERLEALLEAFDVVCLSPPIADAEGGAPLNADADVLAAVLANALRADHLRLVTGTAGLLADPDDPASTVADLYPGEGAAYAGGRMKQKVRAAEIALQASADVAICGPDTMSDPAGWTRFWPSREPAPDLALLTRAAAVPSVSGDERELAVYLRDWCTAQGIEAAIDPAGNLVAVKGNGPRRLLMLGHLDTVPFHWPTVWEEGGTLFGRGTVDAKGCLVNFLEVLAATDVGEDCQVRVVGAVEEEVSSSKGAFWVRDHYPADAVVVGEPSGSGTLTLGYHGLFKLRITAGVDSGHSAARDAVSAPDALIAALAAFREAVLAEAPESLSAVIDMRTERRPGRDEATAVLNFRIPPGAEPDALIKALPEIPGVDAAILRATPGHRGPRTSPLARSFSKAFAANGIRPRHVVKKGTSDMNTLATTWEGVPMVAYGPGDSALDHTDAERIGADEVRLARAVLADAVAHWLGTEARR
ncbi:M20/M25/M40 family metallo-hydrolase [Glycomyces sp. TRM65418]|uniref:M20/M25/M40 family metallo-hydrolase n=1 Tax=Glycomyces sp. TRM65418 TaxID=2867006 RepID=UPI001CE5AD08|nr:M20/M25/M40 family metallo-hydrolase [Glycomyces sp. TRM65418]MCC3763471.1 M20/M25/M40 family metallo-hydrolase [Glycomyces sp. TRM65418]QZD57458.1 M20/M25/M40 family metallo-hydrolase [Glycomyces sp. TRM65418]